MIMDLIIEFILIGVYIFCGADNIGDAVESFKKGRYKWFGVHVIVAIIFVALIIIDAVKHSLM